MGLAKTGTFLLTTTSLKLVAIPIRATMDTRAIKHRVDSIITMDATEERHVRTHMHPTSKVSEMLCKLTFSRCQIFDAETKSQR
jgi:hypothetical protein